MNIGDKFYCSKCMRELDDECTCPYCGHDPSRIQSVRFLEEGTLLQNGRYQLGAVIGDGGFGVTYAAWDNVLDQVVAIKEYFPQILCERDSSVDDNVVVNPNHEDLYNHGLERFVREAKILSTLQDVKNVVPVLEWFSANNTSYIVMKYIRGVTLNKYIRDNNIQAQKVIEIMREIVDALVLVHAQGIIHRDISPSNIMIQEDGTMILIDFGAAAVESRREQGEDNTVIYKKRYAPVEQYDEAGIQGPWTDVYALSATLYDLICGHAPAESLSRRGKDSVKSPRDMHIKLKRWQNKAIMTGLAVMPDKRPQSMIIFRSLLYNLPMPEEVTRRRRFMFMVVSISALISIICTLATINFTYGFFLGQGVRYSLYKDGLHVRGYSHEDEKIVIPDKIFGISVVKIDEGAFQGSEKLSELTISGTVKIIDRYAFNNCESLTTVNLNNGVEKLYSQSFANCTNLQAVIMPDSVNDISSDAFSNSVRRLVLLVTLDSAPAKIARELNLNYANVYTQDNDTGITLLRYDTEQSTAHVPDYIDGKPVTEINSGVAWTSVFPDKVRRITLPRYLAKIGDYAFYNSDVRDIAFPDKLEYIGANAFLASSLEQLYLPDSVKFVGNSTFSICLNLHTARLSANMSEIPSWCFGSNIALKSVIIPVGKISEIQSSAFRGCTNLSSLEIPEGVKIIDTNAFMNCIALETLYMPNSLLRIRSSSLEGCPSSLTIIGHAKSYIQSFCAKYGFRFYELERNSPDFVIYDENSLVASGDIRESESVNLPSYFDGATVNLVRDMRALKSKHVILPERVANITAGAFTGNKYIESLSCPPSLMTIDTYAFVACENLISIDLKEGLTKIGDAAFMNCKNLREINLPSTLRDIGLEAFENCINLEAIVIPPALIVLGNDTFSGTGIKSVVIPGNVTKVGTAFYGCKNLQSVVINEGVRTVNGTFAECTTLESVIFPSSINTISRATFKGCENLKDIWIYSDTVELDALDIDSYHTVYNESFIRGELITFATSKDVYMFDDCPQVTIHAYKGSSAHVYATQHNINFVEIPRESSRDITPEISYTVTERVYSDEQIIGFITPKDNDSVNHYWPQFQYAWGYGYMDIAKSCLEYYARYGEDYDKTGANSTLLFLEQAKSLGYETGAVILFFDGNNGHPNFNVGDIIVEVDGMKINDDDELIKLEQINKGNSWTYVILRADDDGMLHKLELVVERGTPLRATRSISPKTFEEF